ncbi:MAG: penicillin-binding transpeptidase domain-containing protein, partial [Actinomycetota bacterium]
AGRGKRPDVVVVTRVTAPGGRVLAERFARTERALDENVADTVNHVLEENIKRGTGTGAKLGRPAAGKTGTAQSNKDALFAGYTPELTAVVWMGFPPDATGNIPVMDKVHGREVTGGSFPATIWKKFMSAALQGIRGTDFATPTLGGEVIRPAPTPCPSEEGDGSDGQSGAPGRSGEPGANAATGGNLINPQIDREPEDLSNCLPSPTPSPSLSPSPTEDPGEDPDETPTPSVSPTKKKNVDDDIGDIEPIGGGIPGEAGADSSDGNDN